MIPTGHLRSTCMSCKLSTAVNGEWNHVTTARPPQHGGCWSLSTLIPWLLPHYLRSLVSGWLAVWRPTRPERERRARPEIERGSVEISGPLVCPSFDVPPLPLTSVPRPCCIKSVRVLSSSSCEGDVQWLL